MKTRNPTVVRCREKCVNWKKTENGENVFFKALPNRFVKKIPLVMIIVQLMKEEGYDQNY